MRHLPLAIASLAIVVACTPQESSAPTPAATSSTETSSLQTDQDKTLYALGLVIGGNLSQFSLKSDEIDHVIDGLRDSVLAKEPKVALNEYGPRIQLLAQERASAASSAEKQASETWVAEQAKAPGAERSATGVVFIPMREGTGTNPTATSTVRVHYHGTLRDGTVFDSSVERNEPISFPLNGVIPCWTEGVQKIKVGGKAKLVCPSETAYGDQGSGSIPPGAALAFEVELLAIE
ncbi:MAG TPA: FKBP-type peptidyl-prolyl cis-trans isomerase [Gammaproteobacteria bacterium]|nr:FKBP-type peptidyl-prolyl cis-trans isomerase [Gammaproteobacteria bacterium]